jgi:serine/threonine protein kinase
VVNYKTYYLGAFGTVQTVLHKPTKERRAMKVINRKDIDTQNKEDLLIREVQILKELVLVNINNRITRIY